MGVDLRVTFPDRRVPAWPAVAERLASAGLAVQMRMIDGELAFPDEQPPDSWRELRVASSGAMVTVRRGDGEVVVVAWGNMDEAQKRLWQGLAEAFAGAGGGSVQGGQGGLFLIFRAARVASPGAPAGRIVADNTLSSHASGRADLG